MTHARHEESDVNVSGVVVFAIALTMVCVVIFGAVRALNVAFAKYWREPARAEYPLASESLRRLPPEPRLQTDPREDLRHLRETEDQLLGSYGWVDRDAGIVRIPIEQAMKKIAERAQ